MKHWLITLLLIVSALPALAKPRIAVVDLDHIYENYQRKIEAETTMQKRVELIQDSERVRVTNQMDARLKELATIIRDVKKPVKVREETAKEYQSLSLEYQSLVQETQEFLASERKKSALFLVEILEAMVADVQAEIKKTGEENGFDLVLDKAGHTSSQTSSIVYLRDSTDITETVLKRLNDKAAKTATPPAK